MRTLLYHHHHDGQPPLLPLPISSPSPSPSPSTSTWLLFPDFFASIPVAKSTFDLATLAFIAGLLLLSVLSLSFIFYLRLKSRRLQHLEHFNSLWTVRLLLVLLSSVWAINEILRLPLVRRKYLYPFLPSITLQQQADICKIHVILSLGLLEPSFLVTLLFLVNVSIKKKNPSRIWALASLFMVCAPMTLLQILFVYFQPFEGKMPRFMHGSSVPGNDVFGNRTMLCTYPIACLSLSWLWVPDDAAYGFVVLAMFLFVMGSMVMGEVILVIKPIMDALAVAGEVQPRLAAMQEAEERPSHQ
ncbi:hypothetical protein PHJA_001513600 [Phtheirospermum japonicum]|uniref:Uncharacterized protein n=1 Tax=Phtheirospermum japonicum TaxID=374723 RepID=A0A830C6C7_9LAMI|nr:hypothetical protein PHJA_001513600 [Phtheirospermum japonicum]